MTAVRDSINNSIKEVSRLNSLKPHELDDDAAKRLKGKRQHWGYHLLLDISHCNEKIDDEKSVEAFLKDLVQTLKMKPIGPPTIVKVHGEQGRGLTAVQIITTSTITFHGDDEEWCVYLDIFSCKAFDPKQAVKLVKEYFKPKRIGKFFLYRDAGRWPKK